MSRARKRIAALPLWVGELERLLVEHAPACAVGYRLGLARRGEPTWMYPHRARTTPRWDGTRKRRGFFSLAPFEPPVVPCAALYGVVYIDAAGAEHDPPLALGLGVHAAPLRRLAISAGQIWR